MTELGIMGSFRKIVIDAILGRRDGEQRLQGYVDCRTTEEYAKAETEICGLMTGLHPTGQISAAYFKTYEAPQLLRHYSVRFATMQTDYLNRRERA